MPVAAAALPLIRPITDLRTNLNSVCEQARETQEPIICTKNGSPALIVMDSEAYEAQRQRDRLYLAIRESEIEARFDPSLRSQEEVDANLEKLFAKWGV